MVSNTELWPSRGAIYATLFPSGDRLKDPSATLGRAPKAAAASNGFVFSATADALAHTTAAMELIRLNLERVDKIGLRFRCVGLVCVSIRGGT